MPRALLLTVCLLLLCRLAAADGRESEFLRLGKASFERHDYARAVESFAQAVRVNPGSAEAQRWAGVAYLKAGTGDAATDPEMVARAVAALQEAVRLDPRSADAHFDLGSAYLALHDKDAAEKEYQTLLSLDPSRATQLLARITDWRRPARFRSESGGRGDEDGTRVTVAGNSVLVPVTLSHNGRRVEASLILDTGASVTVISKAVAQQLGLDLRSAQSMRAQVADGGFVQAWRVKLDGVAVGAHARSGVDAAVVQGRGALPFDGLLGMNFLRNFNYSVDMQRQILKWHQ